MDRSHQTSITLGIELLAKYSYDLEKLTVKRAGCQHIDRDVEVTCDESNIVRLLKPMHRGGICLVVTGVAPVRISSLWVPHN